jgi:hypothetical protein
MKTQAFKNIKLPPTIKGFATDIGNKFIKIPSTIKEFAPDIANGVGKGLAQSFYVAGALAALPLFASGAFLLAAELAIPALIIGGLAATVMYVAPEKEKTPINHPKTQKTCQLIALAAAGTALYALGQYAVNDFKTTYERQYKMGALQESFKIAADKEILPLKIQTAKANSYQPEQNRLVM